MPELSTVIVYMGACALLLVSPGPAVLYVVACSIERGRLAGFVSSLGLTAGTFVHVIAAALGFSAILTSSPITYQVVKYVGAAYLLYLGVRKWIEARGSHDEPRVTGKGSYRNVFYQGVVVSVLNPKLALFVFAFIPQFVDPTAGPVWVQFIVLGSILNVMGIVSDGVYVLLAGSIGAWLNRRPAFVKLQQRFVGTVYIVLGVLAALAGPSRNQRMPRGLWGSAG